MHMLCKTGTVCLRTVDLNLIFDRIYVRKIRTYMCRIFLEDLALALKKILSLFTTPFVEQFHIWEHH